MSLEDIGDIEVLLIGFEVLLPGRLMTHRTL